MRYDINEKNVRIVGRTVYEDGALVLSWSGSSIGFRLKGTAASVTLRSGSPASDEEPGAYIGVFADGKMVSRFRVPDAEKTLEIYRSESEAEVGIRLVKLTEAFAGSVLISAIEAEGTIAPLRASERRLEFIGDSITCGYGNESGADDPFLLRDENFAATYAALTAEAFGADAHVEAWSGIGVYSNSVDTWVEKPKDEWLMPKIWPYSVPAVCRTRFAGTDPDGRWQRWDTDAFRPEAVMLYLGTNDATFTDGDRKRTAAYKQAYKAFVRQLRARYPEAAILCLYGGMTKMLSRSMRNAARELTEEIGNVHAVALPMIEPGVGMGALGHPNTIAHRKMADALIAALRKITGWDTVTK